MIKLDVIRLLKNDDSYFSSLIFADELSRDYRVRLGLRADLTETSGAHVSILGKYRIIRPKFSAPIIDILVIEAVSGSKQIELKACDINFEHIADVIGKDVLSIHKS